MCFATLTKQQVTFDLVNFVKDKCTDMMDNVFDISQEFTEDEYLLICDNLQILMSGLNQMNERLIWNASTHGPHTEEIYDVILEMAKVSENVMTTPNALNKTMEFDELKSHDLKFRKAVESSGAKTYIFEKRDPNNVYMCVYSGEYEGMWDMEFARPKKMKALDVFKLFQLDFVCSSRPDLVEYLKKMGAIRWVTENGNYGYSLLPKIVPQYYVGQDTVVNGIKYQKLCGIWYDDVTGEPVPEELVGQP